MRPPRETPHPSEKALQAACMKRVRDGYDGVAYHPIGTGASKAGEPDVLAAIRMPSFTRMARHVAIELKQPGNKPTARQMKRLRDYEAAGSLAGWATTEAEFCGLLAHLDDPTWTNPQLARSSPA